MLHSNQLLQKFQSLQAISGQVLFDEPGTRLGRGFADLGFEEFVLQGANKLTSLYTGKVGELPFEHRGFFFNIYSADELVELLVNSGFDVDSLSHVEQRTWNLQLRNSAGEQFQFTADSIVEVLLLAALDLFGRS